MRVATLSEMLEEVVHLGEATGMEEQALVELVEGTALGDGRLDREVDLRGSQAGG